MGTVHQLSQDSCRLLSSSNIITSVFSVVKELIENSLDSGANNIEIRLENNGLDKIEVRDNGTGIKASDIPFVAKAHFTSKLSTILDLENLETYGFRGEALGAICTVAQLSITTKTVAEEISQTYVFDKNGDIESTKPSASQSGTAVSVVGLFNNIPVRKKYYKLKQHKQSEIKAIEDLLCAYSCAQKEVRFALFNNKNLIWSKSATLDIKVALIQVFGGNIAMHLGERCKTYNTELKIQAFLPLQSAPLYYTSRNSCDRTLVIVNKRPVKIKAIDKLLQETFCQHCDDLNAKNRYPICVLLLTVPSATLDVNVDPNKSKVLLHNFDEFLVTLKDFLQDQDSLCIPLSTLDEKNKLPNCAISKGRSITAHLGTSLVPPENQIMESISLLEENAIPGHFSSATTQDKSEFNLKEQTCNVEMKKVNNTTSQSTMQQTKLSRNFQTPNQQKSFEGQTNDAQNRIVSVSNQLNQTMLNEVDRSNVTGNAFNKKISTGPLFQRRTSRENLPSFQNTRNSTLDFMKKTIDTDYVSARELLLCNSTEKDIHNSSDQIVTPLNDMSKSNQLNNVMEDLTCATFPQTTPPPSANIVVTKITSSVTDKNIDFDENLNPNVQRQDVLPQSFDNLLNDIEISDVDLPPESFNKCDVLFLRNNISTELDVQCDARSSTKDEQLGEGLGWSRGHLANSSCKTLQPVSVLVPNQTKKRTHDAPEGQQKKPKTSSPLVPDRPKTTFDLFCYQRRIEVAAQNPTFSNKQIGCLLLDEWKRLSDEEKQMYEKSRRNEQEKSLRKKIDTSNSMKRPSQSKIIKKKRQKHKEVMVSFDVSGLTKQNLMECSTESNQLVHIAKLSSGVWVCSQARKLYLLNSYRMRESLLFQRLLETHHLECHDLPEPIHLSPLGLGDDKSYDTLLLLCMKEKKNSILSNECFLANGFKIKNFSDDGVALVVGMSSSIPSFGLQDLREILHMMGDVTAPTNIPLSKCRPFKVSQYLQSEAVRMVRQSLAVNTKSEFEDLVNQVQRYIPNYSKCFHNRPFRHDLFDLCAAELIVAKNTC